jgi:transcriptional regulator with XRE-family HTH domain
MVNNKEIIARINTIREEKGVTVAALAEKIGVQRSSFSHLISGRNKPSLDLLVRLHEAYPEYGLDWLVFGTYTPPSSDRFAAVNKEVPPPPGVPPVPEQKVTQESSRDSSKLIGTILLFEDGSFEHFSSKS